MTWFLIALIAPALWAATNHIDKYLLDRYFKGGGEGALFIFSSIIGLFFIPIVALIHPEALQYPLSAALLIALNGALYIVGLMPYVYALQKGDASVVIPLFQLIPVFSFVLAWIVLGETLTASQLIGGTIIILGSIALSFEMNEVKKLSFNKAAFWLMVLASFLTSLSFLFFKYFALEASLLTTAFWEYVGFFLTAIALFVFIPVYRRQFLKVLKENRVSVLSLNGINEVLNIFGKFSFNFASLLVPITLVWFVVGFQPLFVFAYGLLLTLFFPHISKEKITRGHLAHRIVTICVMLIGTYFLYL
jgi:uncharacterized membrane protein